MNSSAPQPELHRQRWQIAAIGLVVTSLAIGTIFWWMGRNPTSSRGAVQSIADAIHDLGGRCHSGPNVGHWIDLSDCRVDDAWLEAQHETNVDAAELPATNGRLGRPAGLSSNHWQMTLFGGDDHPVLDEIRTAKLDEITPLEALRRLAAWQERLAEEQVGAE